MIGQSLLAPTAAPHGYLSDEQMLVRVGTIRSPDG